MVKDSEEQGVVHCLFVMETGPLGGVMVVKVEPPYGIRVLVQETPESRLPLPPARRQPVIHEPGSRP